MKQKNFLSSKNVNSNIKLLNFFLLNQLLINGILIVSKSKILEKCYKLFLLKSLSKSDNKFKENIGFLFTISIAKNKLLRLPTFF